MPRVSQNALSKESQVDIMSALVRTLASINQEETIDIFLRDLLTSSERIMLAKRLMVSVFVIRGLSSREICSILKMSKSTVNTIRHDLEKSHSGYRKILDSLLKESQSSKWLRIMNKLFKASTLPIKGSKKSMSRWRKDLSEI